MQKFLGALKEKSSQIYEEEYGNIDASTEMFFRTMLGKFRKLEGKKMQYKDKSTRTNAVVVVIKAYPHYVLVKRAYYGSGLPKYVHTAITYGALYCQEATLREEQMCCE